MNGSDSNTGSVNSPYATATKLIGASGVLVAGDTGVIIPTGPLRDTVTCGVSGSNGSPITIIGDYDGAQQQAAGATTVYTGTPIITAYNTGAAATFQDAQAPPSSATIGLNGQSYLTFQTLQVISGNAVAACFDGFTTTHSHDITIQQCAIISASTSCLGILRYQGIANVAANWTIDRCIIFNIAASGTAAMRLEPVAPGAGNDLNLNILVKDSLLMDAHCLYCLGPASGSGTIGGINVLRCTLVNMGNYCFSLNGTGYSTTTPGTCYDCVLSGNVGLAASTTGQMTENFNRNHCHTARTNVTAGTSSVTGATHAPLFHFGQEFLFGQLPRPFMSPMGVVAWQGGGSGYRFSPLLGFDNSASASVLTQDLLSRPAPSGGSIPSGTADVSGTATAGAASTMTDGGKSWTTNQWAGYRLKLTSGTGSGQRRWIISNTSTVLTVDTAWGTNPDNTSGYTITNPGNLPGVGCFEHHDDMGKETSTVDVTPAISAYGPRDHEFVIPVDAVSTTISIKVQWDGSYGGGTLPQIQLLANPEIGISGQTVTATGSSGSWNTVSLSAITASAAGAVKVRLISNAAGNGKVAWDTWSIT